MVIGRKVGKRISNPIKRCVNRFQLLSEGNLSEEVPIIQTNDEAEALLNCLKNTIDILKRVIVQITYQVTEIAKGNLCITVEEDYKGDFYAISEVFRKIIKDLNYAMKEIDINFNIVEKGADDVSNTSQYMAEGATEQASAIEELTAGIEDVTEKTTINAKNLEQAKNKVEKVNTEVQYNNKKMEDMMQAIQQIMERKNF